MLYEILTRYADDFQFFNLFNYITFRVGGALMTSMIIAFILGPRMINFLRSKQGKGLIGFYDDYLKVSRQNPKGFSGIPKGLHP